MNKKISTAVAIGVILLITAIVGTTIWLKQSDSSQEVQNTMPLPIAKQDTKRNEVATEKQPIDQKTNSNNTENISEAMKNRFSGKGCYSKESDGTDNLYELSKDFNLSSPTAKVTYSNQAKGISFDIPYNTNWGNKNCKVEPYIEFTQPGGDVLVEFGKPRAWIRSEFLLTVSDYRSAQDIVNEQKNVGGEPDPNPRKMTLGDKQLVAYESYGMTSERIYEVIGKKFNYSFSYSEAEKLNGKTAKELATIIQSAKIE